MPDLPHGHGFAASTRVKRAGKRATPTARATSTTPLSNGCRSASRTRGANSGASAKEPQDTHDQHKRNGGNVKSSKIVWRCVLQHTLAQVASMCTLHDYPCVVCVSAHDGAPGRIWAHEEGVISGQALQPFTEITPPGQRSRRTNPLRLWPGFAAGQSCTTRSHWLESCLAPDVDFFGAGRRVLRWAGVSHGQKWLVPNVRSHAAEHDGDLKQHVWIFDSERHTARSGGLPDVLVELLAVSHLSSGIALSLPWSNREHTLLEQFDGELGSGVFKRLGTLGPITPQIALKIEISDEGTVSLPYGMRLVHDFIAEVGILTHRQLPQQEPLTIVGGDAVMNCPAPGSSANSGPL